jgi:rare lipoprotein A
LRGKRTDVMRRLLFFLVIVFVLLSGCAPEPRPARTLPEKKWVPGVRPYEVNGTRYYPLPDAQGFVEYGKASWYGKEFHGRPTASGTPYDMYGKSAAHKILPLDTWVKVVNLSNNKSIIVPINDRGPFVKGRVIDLSYGAASELDMFAPGVVDVRVEALAKEVGRAETEAGNVPVLEWEDFRRGEFTVQVGAFESLSNALKLADRFKKIFNYVHVSVYEDGAGRVFYRVHVSKSETLAEAENMEKRLEEMGFPNAFLIRI